MGMKWCIEVVLNKLHISSMGKCLFRWGSELNPDSDQENSFLDELRALNCSRLRITVSGMKKRGGFRTQAKRQGVGSGREFLGADFRIHRF